MAFDTIEWDYMFEVLHRVGIGPELIKWVQLLYAKPLAQIKVNSVSLPIIALERGTRQGCPLSPLLFALTLEPLAVWVRSDHLIRGLNWDTTWEDRISLYADYVLLYLADPIQSIDRVMHILNI